MSLVSQYRSFCATAPADFPLFMQDWYLDAVCERGEWLAILTHKNGKVAGVMPCFVKKNIFGQYVSMPVLGRFMGPYLCPEYRTPAVERELYGEMIAQLPAGLLTFTQDFHYSVTNWMPFYWQKYRQTTRYSYRLKTDDLETLWNNIVADYRNNKIKKAQALVQLSTALPLEEVYRLNNLSYERQGLPRPFSFDFLRRLDAALEQRGQRAAFAATDIKTGETHAVIYLVWDQHSAYCLFLGQDPTLRQSGAGIWLTWECIRYTAEVLKLPYFDFLGSMIPAIAKVREQFGAEPQPYFRVENSRSLLWEWLKQMKQRP